MPTKLRPPELVGHYRAARAVAPLESAPRCDASCIPSLKCPDPMVTMSRPTLRGRLRGRGGTRSLRDRCPVRN